MSSSEMFILFIYVLVSGISFFSMGYKLGFSKGRYEGFIEGQPSMTISKGTNVCFGYESLIHSKGGSENTYVHFPKEEDKQMTLEQILPTHIDVRLSKEHNKPVLGIGRNENGNFVLTILSLNDEKISITAEVDATQLAYFLRVAEFVLDKE